MEANIFMAPNFKCEIMGNKSRKIQFLFILAVTSIVLIVPVMQVVSASGGNNGLQSSSSAVSLAGKGITDTTSNFYSGYSYSESTAVAYGNLVHSKYFHTSSYPAGINENQSQKNLDHYNSEDCAHFVSEALIAGGLTVLANNPPGDNLQGFDGGQFVGSYGIVGAYRLANYLAGYDLPIFPNNSTAEQVLGYYPLPGSYTGSPHTPVYYVTNDSMKPSYFLSPGDVIIDGGAGSGHAMLYIGNNQVIQTDPAAKLTYYPGINYNISFGPYGRLNGQNVTSIYLHMPTISNSKAVRITAISGSSVFNATSGFISNPAPVKLIASYPDGVGFGNYTFKWYDNGQLVSDSQVYAFTPSNGTNSMEVESAGSNGTAYSNFTLYVGNKPFSILGLGTTATIGMVGGISVVVIAAIAVTALRKRK